MCMCNVINITVVLINNGSLVLCQVDGLNNYVVPRDDDNDDNDEDEEHVNAADNNGSGLTKNFMMMVV